MTELLESYAYKTMAHQIVNDFERCQVRVMEEFHQHIFKNSIYKDVIFYHRLNDWGSSVWTLELFYKRKYSGL